jgi:hypothetical protein
MGRRNRRGLRPDLELIERRELLSAITDVLAANSHRTGTHVALAGGAASGSGSGSALGAGASGSSNFGASITLGGSTLNQGPVLNPDGSINNMALAPTGNPKPGELKRQRFAARFVGPYSVVPGRTTTQATQTLIQGGGTSNTMLHSDIQIRLVKPIDSSLPFGGVGSIFDRNINTNTVLGFNLSAPQQNVDRGGRPNHIPTVSIDINASAGTYVESYGQGVMSIRYIPSGKRTAGVLSQGTAIVTLHMQIYAPNASFILRNVGLNP